MPVQPLTPERRRELTRTALVEAAIEVFARRGFEGASLEEIAETAGFTRGAIYSNFGGKEDLLLAVIERYNEIGVAAYTDILEKEALSPTNERAASAALMWRDIIRGDPNLTLLSLEIRLYALRNPDFKQRVVEMQRAHVASITAMIEHDAAANGIKLKIPAQDIAEMMNAASIGLSEVAAIDSDHAERYDRLAEELFVLFGGAIAELPK